MTYPELPQPPRHVTPFDAPALRHDDGLRFPLKPTELANLVLSSLTEDGAFNDITTITTVRSDRRARATLVARQDGVVAGVPFALEIFRLLDSHVIVRVDAEDGCHVKKGETVIFVSGHARALLSAERTALNFMQRLSGIATLTARYVSAIQGTRARILDTRKTTPGWRALEKYAVRAGGGTNHRMDLSAGVLIKDNHLAAADGRIDVAVKRARDLLPPGTSIEVECDSVDQVRAAMECAVDAVLLDNMPLDVMRECVSLVQPPARTEASGGVTLETVQAIAETGVDFISVGALTHSAPAMNLALDFE